MSLGETVTRLRATPVTDPYSDETVDSDWSSPSSLTIEGCGFDPGGSSLLVEVGRVPVVTKPTVYDFSFADVVLGDRLVVRGKTYDVDGEPASWENSPLTGWSPGQVITLKLVEG